MYTKNDLYTFYMFFRANDADEWWTVESSTTYGGCCTSEDATTTLQIHNECCLPSTQDLTGTLTGSECDAATQLVADTTAEIKNFRVLFQMGDDDS